MKNLNKIRKGKGNKENNENKKITDTAGKEAVGVFNINNDIDQSIDYSQLPSVEKLSDGQKAFVEMFDMLLKKHERENAFVIASKGKLPREFYLYAMNYYSSFQTEKIQKENDDRKGKVFISFYTPNSSSSIVGFLKKYLLPADVFTTEQLTKYLTSMIMKMKGTEEEQFMIVSIGNMMGYDEFMQKYYDKAFLDWYLGQLLDIENEGNKISIYQGILEETHKNAIEMSPEEKKRFMKMKIAYGLKEEKNGKKREVDDLLKVSKNIGYEMDETDKKLVLDALLKDLRMEQLLLYTEMFGDKDFRRKLFLTIADRRTKFSCMEELILSKDETGQYIFSPQELQSIAEELVKKGCLEIVLEMIVFLKYYDISIDVDALIAAADSMGYSYDAKKLAQNNEKEIPIQKAEAPEEMYSAIKKLFGSILPYIEHQSQWDEYSSCFRKSDELKKFEFFPEPLRHGYSDRDNDQLYMHATYRTNEESFKLFMEQYKDAFVGKGSEEDQKKVLEVLKIIRAHVPVMAMARAHDKVRNVEFYSYMNSVKFSDSTMLNYIRRRYANGGDHNLGCNEFTRYKSPSECGCCNKTQERMMRYNLYHLVKKQQEDRVYKIPNEVINEKVLEMLTGEERKQICIVDGLIQKYSQSE